MRGGGFVENEEPSQVGFFHISGCNSRVELFQMILKGDFVLGFRSLGFLHSLVATSIYMGRINEVAIHAAA